MNLWRLTEWEIETVRCLLNAVGGMRFNVVRTDIRATIALNVLKDVFDAQIWR